MTLLQWGMEPEGVGGVDVGGIGCGCKGIVL